MIQELLAETGAVSRLLTADCDYCRRATTVVRTALKKFCNMPEARDVK